MKVNIWIHKDDVIRNRVRKYYLWRPQFGGHEDYVMVTIDQQTFVEIEDRKSN